MKLTTYKRTPLRGGTAHTAAGPVDFAAEFEEATFEGGASISAISYAAPQHCTNGRPIVMVTNGGPGSSVLWLHLGLFGPWRVHLDDPLRPPTVPPYTLEDNPHCLLDIADLVMIDPAGCGWSSRPDAESEHDFFSVDGDAHAAALFIERWLIEHERTNSPVYLAGESYGTVRACAMLDALAGGPFSVASREVAISVAGIALLGTAFGSEGGPTERPSSEEACALSLSACAATAAYHHPEIGSNPMKAYMQALSLAPDYLAALYRGRSLPEGPRREMAHELASLLCTPEESLLSSGLRFSVDGFRRSVASGLEVGAYDGRYTMTGKANPGSFPFPGASDPVADDPAMGMYSPSFVGAHRLLADRLGVGKSGPYAAIDFSINSAWDYTSRRGCLASLENAMRRNPSMKLLFGSGIYDLVCWPGSVRHLVDASTLPADRTQVSEYEAGHMAYLGEDSATALEHDLRTLIAGDMQEGAGAL